MGTGPERITATRFQRDSRTAVCAHDALPGRLQASVARATVERVRSGRLRLVGFSRSGLDGRRFRSRFLLLLRFSFLLLCQLALAFGVRVIRLGHWRLI